MTWKIVLSATPTKGLKHCLIDFNVCPKNTTLRNRTDAITTFRLPVLELVLSNQNRERVCHNGIEKCQEPPHCKSGFDQSAKTRLTFAGRD